MSFKPKKFFRKPFPVDHIQVTAENLEQAAKWCDGDVRTDAEQAKYVKVRVHRPMNDRQTKAYVGDYILHAGTGFKVYTPKAFHASFIGPDELIKEVESLRVAGS